MMFVASSKYLLVCEEKAVFSTSFSFIFIQLACLSSLLAFPPDIEKHCTELVLICSELT